MDNMDDIEKHSQHRQSRIGADNAHLTLHNDDLATGDYGEARVDAIRGSNGFLRMLSNLNNRMARLAEFEAKGVERIPEDKRRPPQNLNVSSFRTIHF